MSDWISVDQRMPKSNPLQEASGFVLIFYNTWNEILFARRVRHSTNDYWEEYDGCAIPDSHVTHWMPIPEPPQ